jgi:serine/threonine protein kinase
MSDPGPDEPGSFLSLLQGACSSTSDGNAKWQIDEPSDADELWIMARPSGPELPGQGWKLHISATVSSATDVLGRTLPVLVQSNVCFKVARSRDVLQLLNQGDYGTSQMGKFITVYPRDDQQAVELAQKLDHVTSGLSGPLVPSDRALRPDSRVSYRYGGFTIQSIQLPSGLYTPVIRTPEGGLAPDHRGERFRSPPWVTDPFRAAGIVVDSPQPNPLIGGRYLVAETIFRSPRGRVHLAVDTAAGSVCVLKQGACHAAEDKYGRDVHYRLRHEFDVLNRLGADPRSPSVHELVEQHDDLYLVMEDLQGETLESRVAALAARSCFVPEKQVIRWGIELAEILHQVHDAGYVYRDLKSPNVLISADETLRLIDFEISHAIESQDPPLGHGTRGYISSQQANSLPPTVADDVYGFGAILFFMATAAEPSWAPDPTNLLTRPVRLLNPAVSPPLESVIARCLEPEPANRYSDMSAVRVALDEVEAASAFQVTLVESFETPHDPRDTSEHYLALARRLADGLASEARSSHDASWISRHHVSHGEQALDINTGASGAILALTEAVDAFNDPDHRDVLSQASHWLTRAERNALQPMPGLYVGDSGVAHALLRAGQVLDDGELIGAARARELEVTGMPHTSPDLFNGTAGRLRMHLAMWNATGDSASLQEAVTCGNYLVEAAEYDDHGGVKWTIPPGFDSMSGTAMLGYAHGTAGIADALLDLFEATREATYLELTLAAARTLEGQTVTVLADGSGLNWPEIPGGEPSRAFWCHGATGVGTFLLRAAKLGVYVPGWDLARRAAHTIISGPRGIGPAQCHGLAGNLEFLLDLFQTTGETAFYGQALILARLLETFSVVRDDQLRWYGDTPNGVSPDYMVGYAGIIPCLLRLGDPERRPHQLSLRGLRHRDPMTPANQNEA